MSCIDYIPEGHENAVSRQYLRDMTGMSDRSMRIDLKASRELVLNLQDGKGYFRPSESEDGLVRAYIKQEESRIREIQKTVRKAKSYLHDKQQREGDRKTGQLNIMDFLGGRS